MRLGNKKGDYVIKKYFVNIKKCIKLKHNKDDHENSQAR